MTIVNLLDCISAIGSALDRLHEAGTLHGLLSLETVCVSTADMRDFSVRFWGIDPFAAADISCDVHNLARRHPLNFIALYLPRNTRSWDGFCFGVLISEMVRRWLRLPDGPTAFPTKAYTFDLNVIQSFLLPLADNILFPTMVQTMLPSTDSPALSDLVGNIRLLADQLRLPGGTVSQLRNITPKLRITYYNNCLVQVSPLEFPNARKSKCTVCDKWNREHQWSVELQYDR